jgi:hypothetical protein
MELRGPDFDHHLSLHLTGQGRAGQLSQSEQETKGAGTIGPISNYL